MLVLLLFLFFFKEKTNLFQYYHYKLRNVTENITSIEGKDDGTELQRSYEGWVTLAGGVSCSLGSGINFLTTGRYDF